MAERFERLFSFPNGLFAHSAPVVVSAGALLKDQQSGAILVQIKFQSISPKIIKAVKVSLSAADVTGKQFTGVEDYQYLDMKIACGSEFGGDKAIIMPNYNTRAFSISTLTVVFVDDTFWECVGNSLFALPERIALSSKCSADIIEQYKLATTTQALYEPHEYGEVWLCTCGCINSDTVCTRCRTAKTSEFGAYDIHTLTQAHNAHVEQTRIAKEHQEQQEKPRKQKSKRIKIVIFSVIALAIFALIAFNVIADHIIPESKYQQALECFDNGNYAEGRNLLIDMDRNYKDSQSLILKYSSKGDTVKMGTYAGEPIEWIVLAKENGKLLLISKECLFKHEYSETENSGGNSWYGSTLRTYLNGSFLRTTFTDKEESIILTTTHKDTKQPDYGKITNWETKDKLFLLSFDEAKKYFSSNNERSAGKTYWLRSVGWQYFCASQVEPDGAIDDQGANIIDDFYYVRPAMWVTVD